MHRWINSILAAGTVASVIAIAGCSTGRETSSSTPAAAPASITLPNEAAPVEALKPLAFMSGAWALVQPRGAMIEEHWSAPRGKSMMAMFRRIRGDQITPFYEFTQIVAEPDGVFLRQRHVHDQFEIDNRRPDAMVLRLDQTDGRSASFVPVDDPAIAKAGTLARITYTLEAPNTLTLTVEPRPDSKEQRLEFRMGRIRSGE